MTLRWIDASTPNTPMHMEPGFWLHASHQHPGKFTLFSLRKDELLGPFDTVEAGKAAAEKESNMIDIELQAHAVRERLRRFQITREIGIDAGHRVPDHGSKCRNQHGHRYTIHATCTGELALSGEEAGMVMDFGFLKDLMIEVIDKNCDHANILYIHDPLAARLYDGYCVDTQVAVRNHGYARVQGHGGWLYLVPFSPTAENLAAHWYGRLAPLVTQRSQQRAALTKITVWETPNCFASYPISD